MRGRRMGRPGLIGTMARTAVIAGTATAVSGSVQQKQQAKAQAAHAEQAEAQQSAAEMAAMQAQLAELQAAQAPAPVAPVAAAPVAAAPAFDLVAELEKLGGLKAAGILDDAEFAAAKANLLSR